MKSFLLASVATVFAVAYMSETCETVMIVGQDGNPVRVNKSDYDADQAEGGAGKMTLHDDNDEPIAEPISGAAPVPVHPELTIPAAPSAPHFVNAVAPSTASVDTLVVVKEGKGAKERFFVVRMDGSKVTDMRDVDAAGYESDALAWAAIRTVQRQPNEQTASPPVNVPAAPVLTVPVVETPTLTVPPVA